MPTTTSFLLYGASGYTGNLIASFAKKYKLNPVLAGRSEAKIKPLAEHYGFEYRIFGLDNPAEIDTVLQEFPLVLHTAGPFIRTARPMIEACLRTGTHYLDITGEIPVFELAHRFDKQAREAGILLLPGSGFDVVPTDCLALHLKNQLPDATALKLAFTSLGGGVSHGTATTMAENLGEGGAVRSNGKITKVPLGHKAMWVDFGEKKRFVMAIPWGDVSTAYYSTGIPNIETYMGVSPSSYRWVKLQKYFNWLLRTSLVRNIAKNRINNRPAGPSDEQREKSKSMVWGEVETPTGEKRQAHLLTPEGYTLTAHSSLILVQKVLSGNHPIGFQTPAKAFGADLILEVPGVRRTDV